MSFTRVTHTQEPGGPFLDIERLDLNKYVNRPPMARVLADYCWFVDRNVRKCHELCELASRKCRRTDWWCVADTLVLPIAEFRFSS